MKGSPNSAALGMGSLLPSNCESQIGPAFLCAQTFQWLKEYCCPVGASLVPLYSQFSTWSPEQLVASGLSVQRPIGARVYASMVHGYLNVTEFRTPDFSFKS